MPSLGLTMDIFDLNFFQILGHLSFTLVALSFLLRDILLLRLVAIVAAVCNLLFSYYGLPAPNLIVVFWQAVFVVINTGWSIKLIRERRGVSFTDEERELYATIFRAFTPFEFMKLMRLAHWQKAAAGDRLAAAGARLDDIMLIYDGEVEVALPNNEKRRLADGSFIGEMSFIRGGSASADVRAVRPTRLLRWPQLELRKMLQRSPTMRSTMHAVLSEDLMRKLLGPAPAA